MRNTLAELVSGIRFNDAETRMFNPPRLDVVPRISVHDDVATMLVKAHIVVEVVTGGDTVRDNLAHVGTLLDNLGSNSAWIEIMDAPSIFGTFRFGGVIRRRDGGLETLGYVGIEGNGPMPFIVHYGAGGMDITLPAFLDMSLTHEEVEEGKREFLDMARTIFLVASGLAMGATPAELAPADPHEERRIRGVNKSRRLLKRPQILPCRPVIWNLTKVPAWEERQRAQTLSHREQSRPHAVRGHQRHYRSGKVVSVRPHFRCGIADHMGRDYRVRA